MTSDAAPAGPERDGPKSSAEAADSADAAETAQVALRRAAADRAARAGVQIRELGHDEMPAAAALLGAIWRTGSADTPMEPSLLVALAHAGNYCAGAFDGDRVVGVCVGFFGTPLGDLLHSHIAGVRPADASRGIGAALKLHQRAWSADRGLSTISWTFDPLVARNAFFNLHRLGARPVAYLPDFYPTDPEGDVTVQSGDRMLAHWDVVPTEPVPTAPDAGVEGTFWALTLDSAEEPVLGGRVPAASRRCAVRIPRDVEGLRRRSPRLGLRWRDATRDVLGGLLDDGFRIAGFDPSGAYVLERR